MLQEVKNQFKVTCKTIKYGVMREMLNKVSFITNVLFMILNNASFLILWFVIYSLKEEVGGYSLNQVMLLWGIASSTYGVSHFLFKRAYDLSEIIVNGKLDSYLVQPKNVLISVITSDIEVSGLGDLLYGFIILAISGISITRLFLFTFFTITGAIIMTDFVVILGSLSFWMGKADMIAESVNNLITSFSTYPDGIFKGVSKILLTVVLPVGFMAYFPVRIMTEFNLGLTLGIIVFTVVVTILTFVIFYRGMRRYSSSNLMISRI